MKETYGIKETTELFDAGIALKEAVELSKADDGKVTFRDLPYFVAPIPRLITGVEGAGQVPNELGDLDETEIFELEGKFGELVHDEDYQDLFRGMAIAGAAITRIVKRKKEEQDQTA